MENTVMLNITDLNSLEITKVKPWEILFKYDNKHYLLHVSQEEGERATQELYERTLNKYGNYQLNMVNSKYPAESNLEKQYIKNQKGDTIVYKLIDKKYFVFQLTKAGLVTRLFEEELKLYKNSKALYLKLIRNKEKDIMNLRDKLNRLECCSPDELRNL